MIKPFQIVWELVEFGLQALFLYVLAVIFCIGLIAYAIANNKNTKTEPEIRYIYEKVTIEKEIEKTVQRKECTKLAGCRVLEDGTIEW